MQKVSRPAAVRAARTTKSHASKPASEATRSRSPGGVLCAVGSHELEKEIAEIARLSLDDLRIRWRNLTGRLAPAYLSRALLVRILAYRVQAQTFGDLDRNTARALVRWETVGRKEPKVQTSPNGTDESIDISSAPDRRASEPLILKPGTLLTREWQGRMETVMVVADGFSWNGEVFASLSAAARAMTGTKWNGHRFFGVRPQDRVVRGPRDAGDPHGQVEREGEARTTRPDSLHRSPAKGSTNKPPPRGAPL